MISTTTRLTCRAPEGAGRGGAGDVARLRRAIRTALAEQAPGEVATFDLVADIPPADGARSFEAQMGPLGPDLLSDIATLAQSLMEGGWGQMLSGVALAEALTEFRKWRSRRTDAIADPGKRAEIKAQDDRFLDAVEGQLGKGGQLPPA